MAVAGVRPESRPVVVAAVAVVVASSYGLALELLQLTVPARAFEVGDAVANATGAALAAAAWVVVVRR